MAHITALVSRVHSFRISPYSASSNEHLRSPTLTGPRLYPKYSPPKGLVTLNIGGTKFKTTVATLKAVPNTRLSSLAEDHELSVKEHGDAAVREFFFDHNPFLFQYILGFYRTGELHLPQRMCGAAIADELNYWGLREACISICCWQPYMDAQDSIKTYKRLHREFGEQMGNQTRKGAKSNDPVHQKLTKRQRIWVFLEDSGSSKGAKAYCILTSLLILLNICTYMFGTLAALREQAPYYNVVDATNSTALESGSTDAANYLTRESERNAKLYLLLTTQPHFILFYFDIFCFVFFTLEYFTMLICSPDKLKFARSFLAVCDVLYLVPLGLMLVLYYLDRSFQGNNPDTVIGIIILQGLLAFRVLRIVRVVRHYRGFIVLVLSLRASAKELLLLGVLMVLALLFFANAIFFAELLQHDTFETVFAGFWWSLVTITTIGYGDMYPKSISGYLVASLCAMAGMILVSIPIPVIANNFNTYYAFKNKKTLGGRMYWHGQPQNKNEKDEDRKFSSYMPVTVI